jgi:signal transduction histidine kinase/ligand-binding sensor domain-containing protein/DNA-binding response OmpR family regulator
MKRIVLLFTGVMLLLPLSARDEYRYRNITMNDGLAANTVRNIVQDPYGFIWLGTDNGLCRYDGTQVQTYRIAELGMNQYISSLLTAEDAIYVGTEKGVFQLKQASQQFTRLPMDISSAVTSLSLDKSGDLWVSTMENGVWHYGIKTGQTRQYKLTSVNNAAAQILIDNTNQIWTITNWGGPAIERLNRLHDQFEPVGISYDGNSGGLRMLQTRDGRIWIGSWEDGLLLMHGDGRLEQVLNPALARVGQHIHTLYERADDCISIGCDDGVICFNPKTREWKRFFEDLQIPQNRQSDRFVYAITSDKEGGLWVGTFYGGVHYISPVGKRFEAHTIETGLRGNVISRFCEDKHGRIWIASDDGGLMCYDPKEHRFVDYPHQDVLARQNAHALCFSGDELWVGTYTNGVLVLNIETGSLRQYMQTQDLHSLDNPSCYALYTDISGDVWVGTMEGLNFYNRLANHFERIGKTDAMVIDIDEDWEGRLWVSTEGGGLWQYNPTAKKFRQYRHKDGDDYSLPDDQVNNVMVDESGRLWIGTQNGLCHYDTEHDRFEHIRLEVPSRNVMGIIEDNGALWLSTERGIVRYEPGADTGTDNMQRPQTQRFTRHDGLVSEQFQPGAGLKASDGRIYFGSTNGFNTFYPYQIKVNSVMPPVYITSLSIMNREEHTAEGLPLDLSQTKELILGYGDARMVAFSFASLSYCSPEKNQYAYMLEGFDRDWNYVGNQNRATYTNLPAGTYLFRVKATNNDGLWSTNEATLKIVVHPPFWWSWYAKLFYLLLIGLIIWYYVHTRLKRAEHRHQLEMQRLNEEKEKEVREARLNFFTMIAHEIRTPVSLIIGPLEKLMKVGSPTDDLRVINRNAHRLLELVNQLLDFRKVEQQSLVIHFAPQNIHELIKSISERFAPTFEQGGKHFSVEFPDEQFTAIIDREAVTKVVSNLLTNANKYTTDEVRLSCHAGPDEDHFQIVVADNGIGIKEEDQQRIFEPFFQAEGNKPGTGIGLNIVKNIVDLHHGTISVASAVGKGSTFTVVLPVSQQVIEEDVGKLTEEKEPYSEADSRTSSGSLHLSPSSDHQGETMLIVDDSEDMVGFLSENFKEKYEVMTASDGIEALDILSKHEVNIIISDWMMPRMDGAELCRRVRQNQLTSHIPFVMLTAKTDDDSKVEGMDVGADTYIEKPFSLQYLEACIRNMLLMRRRLMEKFSTQPLEPVTKIAQNPTDNEFLIKMNQIIEDNFSNSDLNVDFLADRLNISRSGLFAKIKTLADVTPNEMIQIVRLKRAAQLLHEGGHLVSEVGYMVGFSNPSYFSKCFQKQFGIRPTDYIKKD